MSNRNTTFLLKKSGIPGKVPTQLALGEVAINFADGILYASGTTIGSIIPIGWDRVAKTGDTMTGPLFAPTISATTYLGLPIDVTITGGTLSSGTATFTNNTGGTFSISGFNAVTGGTFNGGTVTGATNFTNGLTANTISATTYLGILGSFGLTIDGAGSVITTGVKGYAVIPFNGTIIGWDIIGNVSGSCVVDIWKNTTIPTSANTITGTEIPTLTNQQINSDNTLTTWNTNISLNDIIAFNVISASTVSRINLIVKIIKK